MVKCGTYSVLIDSSNNQVLCCSPTAKACKEYAHELLLNKASESKDLDKVKEIISKSPQKYWVQEAHKYFSIAQIQKVE